MERKKKRNNKMLDLHRKGLSLAYIARIYAPISRQRVWQIVKDEAERLSTPTA